MKNSDEYKGHGQHHFTVNLMKRINDSFRLITFELRNIDICMMWLAETEINKN